jgi:hypothetical protein
MWFDPRDSQLTADSPSIAALLSPGAPPPNRASEFAKPSKRHSASEGQKRGCRNRGSLKSDEEWKCGYPGGIHLGIVCSSETRPLI